MLYSKPEGWSCKARTKFFKCLQNSNFEGRSGPWNPLSVLLGRFARTLAQQSGLDYAIMTGGDVGPLGKEAVHEINKLSAGRLRGAAQSLREPPRSPRLARR